MYRKQAIAVRRLGRIRTRGDSHGDRGLGGRWERHATHNVEC